MKILIATSNRDKFSIISKMLKTVIGENLNIKSLLAINPIEDIVEEGNNIERAKIKALNALNKINEEFDYILGIDDGIIINNVEYVAVKDHLHEIISGNEVEIGSILYITRAYYLISKTGFEKCCFNKIPYILRKKLKEYEIKGYPLNNVISTVDDEIELKLKTEEELNNYFIKYSLEDLLYLTEELRKEAN